MKNRSEIVKYPPWNYVNGCYIKDEWTDYSEFWFRLKNKKWYLYFYYDRIGLQKE